MHVHLNVCVLSGVTSQTEYFLAKAHQGTLSILVSVPVIVNILRTMYGVYFILASLYQGIEKVVPSD